jgi:plasmid stabilization system protein ParE
VARVIYAEEALADLERIADFLLLNEGENASAVFADLRLAVEALQRHPLIGRKVEAEFRELVISRGRTGYVALYRYTQAMDLAFVLRIRHQREAGYRE